MGNRTESNYCSEASLWNLGERQSTPATFCKADWFPQFQLSWWKNDPLLEWFAIENLPFNHDIAMHLAYLSSWSKYTSQVFYRLPHGYFLCSTPLQGALNRVHQHILLKVSSPLPPEQLDTMAGNNGPQSELGSTGPTSVICSISYRAGLLALLLSFIF